MGTATKTINIDNTNDTTFRAWGKAISEGLQAAGLVKTADTGQVDWDTAVLPAANNSVYEIYKFDDAVASAQPCLMRVDYGPTQYSQSTAQCRMTFGTTSNGAGVMPTISGVQPLDLVGQWMPQYVARQWLFSGDGSGFTVMYLPANPAAGGQGFLTVVDRFRDDDGTPNGRGLYVMRTGQSSNQNLCMMINLASKTAKSDTNIMNVPMPVGSSAAVDGLDVYTFPHYVYSVKPEGVSLVVLAMFMYDIPYGTTFEVSHLGEQHTFLSLGTNLSYGGLGSGGSYVGAAILWE